MEIGAILGMALVAFGMVITPGPNMIYLLSRSIMQGRRAGFVSLGGTIVGFAVYLTATCFGLTAIFALVPSAYLAIKLAGAAYLLWLAWKTVKPGGNSPFAPRELDVERNSKLFTMGLLTNLLNPKAAILYLSLLPQFIDPQGPVLAQSLVLGSVQIAISAAVNATIIVVAGSLSAYLMARPSLLRIQRWVMGATLGVFAVKLATDRSKAVLA